MKRRLPRALMVLTLMAAMVFGTAPTALGLDTLDISPGWQQDTGGTWTFWTLSARNTSSGDDIRFYYGDGGYDTHWNIGAHTYWSKQKQRKFPWLCSTVYYTQTADHLNSSAFDNSTAKIIGGTPC